MDERKKLPKREFFTCLAPYPFKSFIRASGMRFFRAERRAYFLCARYIFRITEVRQCRRRLSRVRAPAFFVRSRVAFIAVIFRALLKIVV